MSTRSEGERVRLRHALERLRATCDATALVIESSASPSPSDAEAVISAALGITIGLSRLGAFIQAEDDALPPVCVACSDTHLVHREDNGTTVMCTRCPTPCRKCACNGGRGAYCERARCTCSCHEAKR